MSLVCGPCAVQNCAACTGLLRTQLGFCACSDRGHIANKAPIRTSVPCEVCPRLAWEDGESRSDGVRAFMCAEGHLKLVAEAR
jgi:hypothetical protein